MNQLIGLFLPVLAVLQVSSEFQCGISRVTINQLIVNGHRTSEGQWPWHAALYDRRSPYSEDYVCGGTLISEWYVLSAAHCVVNKDTKFQLSTARLLVRLGVHNLKAFNNRAVQDHPIEKVHNTDRLNPQNMKGDIALLKLGTKAEFGLYVQPACLNELEDLTGQTGTAIGWGLTENNTLSVVLKSARMPVIHPLKCLSSDRVTFGNTLDEGMFCAGYTTGTAVCNGDSGGGLFFQRGGAWYLGGIISFSAARDEDSTRCNTQGYGVFTKVSKYLTWIGNVTGIEAEELPAEQSNLFTEATTMVENVYTTTTTTTQRPQRSDSNAQSSCSGILTFQQGTSTNQNVGLIKIANLDFGRTVNVIVTISVPKSPEVNVENPTLTKPDETIRGKPAEFRFNFEPRNIRPSVVSIVINGQTICMVSPPPGNYNLRLGVHHEMTKPTTIEFGSNEDIKSSSSSSSHVTTYAQYI